MFVSILCIEETKSIQLKLLFVVVVVVVNVVYSFNKVFCQGLGTGLPDI